MGRFFKIFGFLKYVLKARKRWVLPKQTDLLIFDACGSEFIQPYLSGSDVEIFHNRGEEINLNVLFRSLLNNNGRGFFRNYIDSFISLVSPRLILTFIDNSYYFYELKNTHSDIKTLSIQNGYRDSSFFIRLENGDFKSLSSDYICVFGNSVSKLYSQKITGEIIQIGSIKNNMYDPSVKQRKNTILFISQYREVGSVEIQNHTYSFEDFFQRPDSIVLSFLNKYAEKNQKELSIILSGKGENEKEYFRKLVHPNVKLVENKTSTSSYSALDEAEIVVSIDSTLGYESAARGNKTAFFAIRNELLNLKDRGFGWPAEYENYGQFWTNISNEERFERILDYLFEISQEQWFKILKDHKFDRVMKYDSGNSILTKTIANILNET